MKKNLTFFGIFAFLILLVWEADRGAIAYISWRSFETILPLFAVLFGLMGVVLFVMSANFVLHKVLQKQQKEALCYAKNISDDETIVLNRKEVNKAMMLLVDSMVLITQGDLEKAKTNLADLKKIIGDDVLIDILLLKIYKGEKNFDKMEELSAKLESNPNLKLVGFKADIEAKMQKKQFAEALKTANKAYQVRQDLYWVIESAFNLRVKSGDFEGALQVLNSGFKKDIISKENYQKFKAVVLYELAKSAKEKDDNVNCFKFCSQALECAPNFVPAALLMVEYYVQNDKQTRKASKILSRVWRLNPTLEVAKAYLDLWPEDSITEKVQKMESLALTNGKNSSVNNMILADLYCKAGLWNKARNEFEVFLINNPATKKMAKTIAYYEKHANNNEKAADNWKKKATSCLEDDVWVCSTCGHISSKWHAYCKKCDEVGSFEWQLFADKK